MKAYQYIPGKDKILISSCVFTADNFFQRLSGLIFRKPLVGNQALLLKNCGSIHTHWMTYPLDVIFLDKDSNVVAIFEEIKPWNSTPFVRKASRVLEFRAGFLKDFRIDVGDRIIFQ